MAMKIEEYNHICVITLAGDFVGDEIAQARSAVDELIDKRHIVDFVFDFEKAAFVDSQGLETLLMTKRRCEEHFGQVKLVHLDENCRKILEITRLEPRFEIHEELEPALKNMR